MGTSKTKIRPKVEDKKWTSTPNSVLCNIIKKLGTGNHTTSFLLRGLAINLVVPLCRNLLCHFLLFFGACSHFWPYKGICQKSIMPFGIIFSETVRLLHRGTMRSIALPLIPPCFFDQLKTISPPLTGNQE